jgi:hypothetical protein
MCSFAARQCPWAPVRDSSDIFLQLMERRVTRREFVNLIGAAGSGGHTLFAGSEPEIRGRVIAIEGLGLRSSPPTGHRDAGRARNRVTNR